MTDSAVIEGESASLPSVASHFRLPLLIGAISALLIVTSVVLIVKSTQTAAPIEFSREVASPSGQAQTMLRIDVAGAVERPGVYELMQGTRIEDAIAAAGGLSQYADSIYVAKAINRAAKLVDGGKVYIPKQGDVETSYNQSKTNSQIITSHNNTEGNALGVQTPVSINTASQSELEALPGVGPVTAQKIIANRPYAILTELVTKKAIGQSLFVKLDGMISL